MVKDFLRGYILSNICFYSYLNFKIYLAGEQVCKTKDSDSCLQKSPGWSKSYTCENSRGYCTTWSKDLKRCCPKACKNTEPFTEYECRVTKGKGSCTYPNDAQCSVNGKIVT